MGSRQVSGVRGIVLLWGVEGMLKVYTCTVVHSYNKLTR